MAETRATPRTTNGCAWTATSPPSASPTTRRRRWATWCSSNCPSSDREVAEGEACAVVESVKAARDVYAPLAGKVVEINETIVEDPALVNSDADRARAGSSGWSSSDPDAFDDADGRGRLHRVRGDVRGMMRRRSPNWPRWKPPTASSRRHIGPSRGRDRRHAARGRRGEPGRSGGADRAGGDPQQPARSICRRRSTRPARWPNCAALAAQQRAAASR